ncbi:alpha-2-macroglobulin isoform X3 [Musca domestica]|uniref:TEP1-F n=1 Tax=Musca domestica TaxID=7370 RepID=A0A1I8MYI5_MUSDO|nr:alpha-2-macroglobulin isoform X3 [Musca domestica]
MRRTISFAFVFLQILLLVNATGFYTIVAPGTIQSNYEYDVSVTLHDSPEPAKIKVGITGKKYNNTQTVNVASGETKVVHFDITQLEDGDYKLETEGVKGLTFKNSTELVYKNEGPKVYIQTDKAVYKPGDLVQYRILALDENTRPAKLHEPLNVGIRDGAGNHIKQLNDIQMTKGVYAGEFQLSEQPVLGNWVLDVTAGKENKAKTEKNFEVAKYVLPKFSVEIETAKDVAIYDGVIKITVRSKYTYGKPVKGKATVSIASSSRTQAAEKTIDVDGKGHLEFDMVKDLKLDRSQFDSMSQNQFRYYGYLPPLEVLAVVTEGYTGNSQNKTTSINLEPSRYRINVPQNVYEYVPKKPFEIKAYVQKLDGSPVRDAKTKAKLSIKRQSYYWMPAEEKIKADYVYESDVKDDGSVLFTVTIPDTGYYGDVTIQYEEKTHYLPGIRSKEEEKSSDDKSGEKKEESFGPLKIVKKSESYKLSDDVEFEVKSDDPMPYFVYVITGRGKILEQKYVALEDNVKSHKVSLKPTFDMVPNAKVYAYYVKNGDLKFNEATINFSDDFENKIEITAPEQAKPSEEVTLNIKADPDSFIGLMGVDQSVLLLKAGNDLDPKSIKSDLNSYDTRTPYIRGWGDYPGKESGLVTLTNANYPYNEEKAQAHYAAGPVSFRPNSYVPSSSSSSSLSSSSSSTSSLAMVEEQTILPTETISFDTQIRENFIENWIFNNLNNTDASGMAKLSKKIPDTITSWVVTGFAMNEKTGFAMAENPTKIKVFQPFFISTNLPYSVKRGEVISIPIVVFNYMEKSLDAEVTMENTDEEYDFTEATNDIEESVLEEKQRTKSITVPSNGGQTVSFMIRPNKVGDITLKIKAISALAGDAIHQKLKVEPEGVTHYENHAIFVNIPDKQGSAKHELQAPIPKDAVLDSEYLEFSAVGDILGPTIKNIDKLVRMPYGCGEQNMVNFVPNILVLYYLDAIKKDMPLIAQKAKSYMESGYQRELTYKHKNGAYSAFGEGRSEDNSWLTAYVARSFIQARKYITIDAAVIDQALEFLAKTQAEDGHFPQKGKLFHPAHQNDVGFTAFALLAFLEDTDYASKYKPQIQKALQYLADHIEKEDNIYALAIAGVVLNKVHHPDASKLLEKLEKSSTFENGLKWWSNANKDHSNDIEVTSYILQSLVETEEAGKLLPIVQWLVGQRNSLGGFDSTQDTVVGLQALIKFAERFMAVGGGDGKMSIAFEAKDGEGHETTKDTIEVDKDNALLLQTHVLPKSSRQVSMTATGQGSCLVQLSYRYNLATRDDKPSFAIKHELKETPTSHQLLMNVCAEYQPGPESQLKESNMAVMEISLPSGFTADSDSFDKIRNANQVQRVETKNSETVIIVYFESLKAAEPVCFDVFAEKSHAVAKQKPAAITVYDYYNTEQRATVYYEVKSSLCDICEKDECGQGCSK